MKVLVYILIIYELYMEVKGTPDELVESHNCKDPLCDAGCDEGGNLLAENVCLNSSYHSSELLILLLIALSI